MMTASRRIADWRELIETIQDVIYCGFPKTTDEVEQTT